MISELMRHNDAVESSSTTTNKNGHATSPKTCVPALTAGQLVLAGHKPWGTPFHMRQPAVVPLTMPDASSHLPLCMTAAELRTDALSRYAEGPRLWLGAVNSQPGAAPTLPML